ncbi:molybdopterin adenylyltransferase [Shewanella saliphila]|uniref:Molybdopterin adenylyltransferase n=2 Tax=Shewanella saliphila TaxID=2282698 RepID=A0ABQ2Q416_9GAMM|nr:molybdopterin adenylyltransferase [Shewanella saliphila]
MHLSVSNFVMSMFFGRLASYNSITDLTSTRTEVNHPPQLGKITMSKAKIGIVTVSDRASAGVYEDLSGKAIIDVLNEYLTSEWEPVYKVIPDEQDVIEATLIDLADNQDCCLIVTTGGTGPAKRDVTPEATEAVCDRMMPGFGELMRTESLKFVPTAILSRQTAGLRDDSLIVNLPGKPKSIRECLDAVFPAIPYCIDLMDGPFLECDEAVIKPFRPKAK